MNYVDPQINNNYIFQQTFENTDVEINKKKDKSNNNLM